MSRFYISIFFLFTCIVFFSCKKADITHGYSAKEHVSLGRDVINLAVGDTINMNLIFNSRATASENSGTNFTWTIEDPQLVSLEHNADRSVTMTALAIGKTKIKVESAEKQLTTYADIVIIKANVLEFPVYIDFGLTDSPSPWNNIKIFKSGKVTGLTDEKGTNTGIDLEITDDFNDQNGSGVINNALGIPSTVSGDAFWGDNGNPTAAITLSNLNKRSKFDFAIYGSRRDVGDNRETSYTVKGENEVTVSLNASSNTSQLAMASGIKPNADGIITITVRAGPNNNNGSKYYYINAMMISPAK